MKYSKFLLVLAVSALTLSCSHGYVTTAQKTITEITATYADNETRTLLDYDETSILWSPKDEISVFYNGDGVKFTAINSKPKDRTIFISSYSLIYGGTETSSQPFIYAAYPYSSTNAQSGETITLTLPADQTAVEGSFGLGCFPSVGRSKDTNISFYNVGGGVRFSVCQSGISSVELSGNNDEVLAGIIQVSFGSDNRPVVSKVEKGIKKVTLSAPSEEGFEVGKWYYISTIPVEFEKGISVTFRKTNKQIGTKSISSKLEIKRSIFGSISDLDKDVVFSDEASIIIKEAYIGGFTDGTTSKTGIDDYIILYNNSSVDADASDIVFTFAAPYNGAGTNKYYTNGALLYEKENWIPAYGAIWWFTSPVTIPAYSQIVIACFGAIDHTATYAASVDLSKSEYYWMSNTNVSQYTSSKYTVSDKIPQTHYLTCSPLNIGTAWALSTTSPAFYIGKMKASEAEALSKDSENYDHTLGTTAAFNVVKFPKEKVVDAVEIWEEAKTSTSAVRFPADINTGYSKLTNKQGHTTYRNVDKAATEALPENEGKLVTTYDKTLDPSGIDAEASIKNGAHIIYMDTNNSTNDFHQRAVASIK